MLDSLLQIIAPHHCYGCQKTSQVLCDSCIYNITNEPFSGCVVCRQPSLNGICNKHGVVYSKAWCAGDRMLELERMLDAIKFERVKAGTVTAARLLNEVVSVVPVNTSIVPIPTATSHIRERGFDHTALIAKHFAKRRGLRYFPVLQRNHSLHQYGASYQQRFKQAKTAFYCDDVLARDGLYLLIDDIMTTGATIQAAAQVLHDAGAREVHVAIVARQPMKK